MTQFQKAIVVQEVGKPVVHVTNQPIPTPGPQQVQLKVMVAGLNPHDQKGRDFGLFTQNRLPAVLGNDVVGTVTQLGPGVQGISVGDRIVTQGSIEFDGGKSDQSALQEYAVADLSALAKIPDSVSDDEAATLPTNIIAPVVGLFYNLQIPAPWIDDARSKSLDYAGTAVLIIGGGTNCGRFAVQLAKLAGIGKIVAVGGSDAELKGFGATHVLDRHGGHDAVLARIKAVVGDDLLYALDTVNAPADQHLGVNALSDSRKGLLARLVPTGPIDASKVSRAKKAGYEVLNVFGSSQGNSELCEPFWARLPGYLLSGDIKPLGYVAKQGLDAAAVNEVLDAYRDGGRVVKTHFHI
ncbi:alcohol dehydrogenase [Apiospora marii]|uniref:Alcohol dehydrogenase n=1 Tax=Apiospora marii TaxID=335849 RepID=A0ABR1RGF9_9PEZI